MIKLLSIACLLPSSSGFISCCPEALIRVNSTLLKLLFELKLKALRKLSLVFTQLLTLLVLFRKRYIDFYPETIYHDIKEQVL